MNREQQRAMRLAGTVSVPQKFPQLAVISFLRNGACEGDGGLEYLAVEHIINPKLRIRRSFRISDMSAVFLPWSYDSVDLLQGEWFLGNEIAKALPTVLENRGGKARGIAYVPEQAATLMQVEVGMTAAESVEYYPPLPDDRSIDHYALGGGGDPLDPCSLRTEDPCSLRVQDPCSLFATGESQTQYPAALDPCSKLIW